MLKFTEMLWYTGVKSYYNNLGGIDVRKEKKYGYTIGLFKFILLQHIT